MCHPISILKTQNRRCIESPDTIKFNIFFLFIARLRSETGHCYVVFPRVNRIQNTDTLLPNLGPWGHAWVNKYIYVILFNIENSYTEFQNRTIGNIKSMSTVCSIICKTVDYIVHEMDNICISSQITLYYGTVNKSHFMFKFRPKTNI